MPKFVKDVFGPGTYRKGDAVVSITSDDLQGFVDDFHAMQAAGYAVPAPWEHPESSDESGLPVQMSDRTKAREKNRLNAGWVDDLFIEDGTLKAKIDIGRAEDAEQVKANGTFVSPQFGPWTDPGGNRYPKAITHLALTTHPVVRSQSREFTQVALSELDSQIRLSCSDKVQMSDPSADPPVAPPAESGEQSAEMAAMTKRVSSCLQQIGIVLPEDVLSGLPAEAMQVLCAAIDSHIATKQAAKAESAEQANPQQSGQVPAGVNTEPTTVSLSELESLKDQIQFAEGESTEALRGKLKSALKALGMQIADDSAIGDDPETLADMLGNLARHVEYRCRRMRHSESDYPMAFSENEAEMTAEQTTQLSELQSQNTALMGEVTRTRQADYERRISACEKSGRCGPDRAGKLRDLAGQYQFSESSQPGHLDIELEVVESLPPGAVWTDEQKVQQFSVRPEPDGSFFTGEDVTEEEAEKLADEMLGV